MTTLTRRIRTVYAKPGEKLLEALPLNESVCKECGKPMFVADGTLQLTHGECKKAYKQRLRGMKKHPHLYGKQ